MSHKITHHAQTKHSTQSYTNNKGHVTHNEYNIKKSKEFRYRSYINVTITILDNLYDSGNLEYGTSHAGLEIREYGRKDPSRWPRGNLYPQKLALTSPISGCRSVGIVRFRTKATDK
jgi:hypothetical protein